MKKIFISLFTLILIYNANAQELTSDKGNWEFGSTLISLNSLHSKFNYEPDKAPYEIMNGIFFRYVKNRSGIRFISSYSESNLEFDLNGVKNGGKVLNRDFRLGLGGQYTILKKWNILYLYSDVLYRNIYTNVYHLIDSEKYEGEIVKKSNGFDTNFGLGFKIKISKNIFVNPEIGSAFATKFIQTNNFNNLNYGNPNNKYVFYNISPLFKIHLTVKF